MWGGPADSSAAEQLPPSALRLLEQGYIRAALVEGREKPVVELQRHPLRAALDLVLLRVGGEVAAGVVQGRADTVPAGQVLVERAEERACGLD